MKEPPISSGVKVYDPQLKWLRPVFIELSQVTSYYRCWNKQPPYWNNETASVSLIVSSAARRGYFAISDYRREKRKLGAASKGRCDLLLGRMANFLEIEAKQAFYSPGLGTRRAIESLRKATTETKYLWRAKHRAALTFTAISLSRRQAKEFDENQFLAEIDLKKDKCGLKWWWFDSDCTCSDYKSDENDRYYPGVAVFMKKI